MENTYMVYFSELNIMCCKFYTHGAFTEAHVTCAMCVNTLHFSKVVNLYFWRPIWFPTIHPSIHPSSECWTQFQLTGREAGYTLDSTS